MASENPSSLLQDLDLSAEEVTKLTNAFQDPEFRRLFGEYAAELSDPENRQRYEEEITMLERERGVEVQFVHPEPGHVLRTSLNGAQRCFVNICSNLLLGRPSSKPGTGGPQGSSPGQIWSLPYSLAPGREYLGRQGAHYKVYDVIFHPDTLSLGKQQERFRIMINSTALEAVEKQFGVKLDRRNAKTLKIKYKGTPEAAVLRKPLPGGPSPAPEGEESGDSPLPAFPYPYPSPEVEKRPPAPQPQGSTPPLREESSDPAPTTPRYSVVQRHHVDLQDYRCSRDSYPSTVPRELVVTIELPLLRSAEHAVLEVTEKQLLLDSRKPDYSLRLPLPYPVDESRGNAQFNKAKRRLIVTLPVVPPKHSISHLDSPEEGEPEKEKEEEKEAEEKEEEEKKETEKVEEKKGEEEEKKEAEEKEEVSISENGLPKQEGAEDLVEPLASKGIPETEGSLCVYTSEKLGSQSNELLRDTRIFKDLSQEIPSETPISFQSRLENSWALASEEIRGSQEGTMQNPTTEMVATPSDISGQSLVIKANLPLCPVGQELPSGTMALPAGGIEVPLSRPLSLTENADTPGTSGQPLTSKANLQNGTGGEEPALLGGIYKVPPSGTLNFPGNTGSPEEPKEKTTIGKESLPETTSKVQPRETLVISESNGGNPLCPPLQCNENEESLTLIIQVPQVQPQSLQSDLSPHQYKLCFSTQDFVSYSFILQFAPENKLSIKEPKINISSFNAVIELTKSPESLGHWKKWYFGLGKDCLQESFFVSEENVDEFLQGVLNFKKSTPKTQPLIEVLEVSGEKTQIQLKSQEDSQNQLNEKEQRIDIRSHLAEKENMLQTNTKNSNNIVDVEKGHAKGNAKPSDSYTADKALEKSSCGTGLCLPHELSGVSTEVIGKCQQSDSASKPVFTEEKIAVYSNNEKQNLRPSLMEEKKLDEDHILQSIKETNMKDGSVHIIKEHTTNCAFTFQNTLLYDLD
ncbi:protein kintoun [Gracilinanus agilis]|uniref:protein kintoun n=1 Tax=Gracilinanus agilis TaxID=191870 RepID=UPI001CFD40CA|nr:protein kintoun [Gracilinanus agilis]